MFAFTLVRLGICVKANFVSTTQFTISSYTTPFSIYNINKNPYRAILSLTSNQVNEAYPQHIHACNEILKFKRKKLILHKSIWQIHCTYDFQKYTVQPNKQTTTDNNEHAYRAGERTDQIKYNTNFYPQPCDQFTLPPVIVQQTKFQNMHATLG